MLVEKICCRMIRAQPILVPQKIVYLVRIDQLFEGHAVRTQPPRQIDRLRKLNVAIGAKARGIELDLNQMSPRSGR